MIKIVFFGTPYYIVPILEALHKNFKDKSGESPIAAVVTQSPKPVGRKQLLEYSPVDTWAYKKDIPILFNPAELITKKVKADVGVLASYGELVPRDVIEYFPHGILVIHPSLLPEFRWGSPVPATIVTNTNPTGVSIIKMDENWDHGPIVTQFKEDVLPNDTYGSLRDRLFANSTEVVVQMLPAYLKGEIKLKKQDDSKATFARIIKKEDAFIPPEYLEATLQGRTLKATWKIDFIKGFETNVTSEAVERFIRAMNPWPQAWSKIRISLSRKLSEAGGKNQELRIKILKAHLENLPSTKHGPKNSKLVLDEVQLEGKNQISWKQLKEGYQNADFKTQTTEILE